MIWELPEARMGIHPLLLTRLLAACSGTVIEDPAGPGDHTVTGLDTADLDGDGPGHP